MVKLLLMAKIKIILLLLLFPLFATAQTARFYADSMRLGMDAGSKSHLAQVLEMEWIINGQHMHWGSDTVHVIPDANKLDTVFFKASKNAKWDTIICNISKPEVYTFMYNPCCGNFYLRNERMKGFPEVRVNFRVAGKLKTPFLGLIDQSGKELKSDTVKTMKAQCRSAMASNICHVELRDFSYTQDSANSHMLMCLDIGGGREPVYDYYYKSKKTYTSFLYMPLDETPLELLLQTKSGRIVVR